jgi:short-subunit dehydrogenase involved in D-alanine esterification of teichoic acids
VLAQFPVLDTLINNAGVICNLDLNQARDLNDITREIEINLNGPVRMVQQFLPHLKTRKGALIVTLVRPGFHPFPASPVYVLRHEGCNSLGLPELTQIFFFSLVLHRRVHGPRFNDHDVDAK